MDSFSAMISKLKYIWSKTNRWHYVIFLFLVVELRLIPGGQVGFQCNDPALSHPFTGDTISWKWLMGVTVLLPLAVMLFVERLCHAKDDESGKRRVLLWYKEYVFSVLLNLAIIQLLKLAVGSPRPHFFDTCQPKEALTCEGSEYVSSYTCTKAYWLNQSDKSFPSGHTSLALHAGIFIAYYLHRRAADAPCTRAVVIGQLVSVLSAVYCSVSRMWDHRHHWWDVLAGAVIATPILLYTRWLYCHLSIAITIFKAVSLSRLLRHAREERQWQYSYIVTTQLNHYASTSSVPPLIKETQRNKQKLEH